MQIKENKEVLFGAFSDTLRKEDKVKQWKELASLAQSICLMPLEKDWTYARDTLWQNLKKSAVVFYVVFWIKTDSQNYKNRKRLIAYLFY